MEDEATAYPEGTACGEDEPTEVTGDVAVVVAAMHEADAFTPQMLVHGSVRGGKKQKPLEQQGQWEYIDTILRREGRYYATMPSPMDAE